MANASDQVPFYYMVREAGSTLRAAESDIVWIFAKPRPVMRDWAAVVHEAAGSGGLYGPEVLRDDSP